MSVPRAISLGPGVAVNIVLKRDQPTGKLTTGKIQDLLSRGDHPRGIKVRLQDGQIGRVQSLAASTGSMPASDAAVSGSQATTKPKYTLQEDARNYHQPPAKETSLEDYIKVKPAKRGKGKRANQDQQVVSEISDSKETVQIDLEKEFPDMDSSLIAAILNDSTDAASARKVLQSLSTT